MATETVIMCHPQLEDGKRVIHVSVEAVPHWKRCGWVEYKGEKPLTPAEEMAKEARELAVTRQKGNS